MAKNNSSWRLKKPRLINLPVQNVLGIYKKLKGLKFVKGNSIRTHSAASRWVFSRSQAEAWERTV